MHVTGTKWPTANLSLPLSGLMICASSYQFGVINIILRARHSLATRTIYMFLFPTMMQLYLEKIGLDKAGVYHRTLPIFHPQPWPARGLSRNRAIEGLLSSPPVPLVVGRLSPAIAL